MYTRLHSGDSFKVLIRGSINIDFKGDKATYLNLLEPLPRNLLFT